MDKSEEDFWEEFLSIMMPPMPCPIEQEEFFPLMIPPMPCSMEQMGKMPEFKHSFRMHMKSLKLDQKQKEALNKIENDVSKELIKIRADEQIAEIELNELLNKEIVDLKAVETKLKQITAIKTKMQLIVIKSLENVKAKLTTEQREILKKIRPIIYPIRPPIMRKAMHTYEMPPLPFLKEREE